MDSRKIASLRADGNSCSLDLATIMTEVHDLHELLGEGIQKSQEVIDIYASLPASDLTDEDITVMLEAYCNQATCLALDVQREKSYSKYAPALELASRLQSEESIYKACDIYLLMAQFHRHDNNRVHEMECYSSLKAKLYELKGEQRQDRWYYYAANLFWQSANAGKHYHAERPVWDLYVKVIDHLNQIKSPDEKVMELYYAISDRMRESIDMSHGCLSWHSGNSLTNFFYHNPLFSNRINAGEFNALSELIRGRQHIAKLQEQLQHLRQQTAKPKKTKKKKEREVPLPDAGLHHSQPPKRLGS